MSIPCDANSLAGAAQCLQCNIPPGMELPILNYLLCQIANNTGGGGGVQSIIAGNGISATTDGSGNVTVGQIPQIYRALITQSGTNAPTMVVLENSLGFVPNFAYTSAGTYTDSTNTYPANKTAAIIGTFAISTSDAALVRQSGTSLVINSVNLNFGSPQDGGLVGQMLEIYIYP